VRVRVVDGRMSQLEVMDLRSCGHKKKRRWRARGKLPTLRMSAKILAPLLLGGGAGVDARSKGRDGPALPELVAPLAWPARLPQW